MFPIIFHFTISKILCCCFNISYKVLTMHPILSFKFILFFIYCTECSFLESLFTGRTLLKRLKIRAPPPVFVICMILLFFVPFIEHAAQSGVLLQLLSYHSIKGFLAFLEYNHFLAEMPSAFLIADCLNILSSYFPNVLTQK